MMDHKREQRVSPIHAAGCIDILRHRLAASSLSSSGSMILRHEAESVTPSISGCRNARRNVWLPFGSLLVDLEVLDLP